MAKILKKKAKKTVRKPRKAHSKPVSGRNRKKRTKPPTEFSEQEKNIILHRKIHAVMKENPQLECNLKGEDDEGRFGYVEAATVFRMYNKAFSEHSLDPLVTDLELTLGDHCVLARIELTITDITTGYSVKIYGGGLGMNGQWAANTAQTLAMKEALLLSFLCSWPQPEEFREEVQRVSHNTFGPANSPQQLRDAVKEVMDKYSKGRKTK